MRRWLTLDSRILSNTTQVLQGGQMREEGRAGSVCTATGWGESAERLAASMPAPTSKGTCSGGCGE